MTDHQPLLVLVLSLSLSLYAQNSIRDDTIIVAIARMQLLICVYAAVRFLFLRDENDTRVRTFV